MNIFNSLGSNYNLDFVLKTLFSRNDPTYGSRLISFLDNKYQGKTILVYKGREAIKLALDTINLPKNSEVAINGLTCYAVFKAIEDAGYKSVYLDANPLNFTKDDFENTLKLHPQIRVLIIQNTLGFPCDIEELVKICKQKSIILIEDLAHSIGAIYKNGQEAGSVGDFTTLSFSQDKMIDAISGGALIARNKHYQNFDNVKIIPVKNAQQIIDRIYPLFTYLIRHTYKSGLGKIIHSILKKTNLLSKPMGSENSISVHSLPDWYCNLINLQFKKLAENLSHRRRLASFYAENINSKLSLNTIYEATEKSSNLRFPIVSGQRDILIQYLQTYGIYISDIWYDAPIAPKKYLRLTDYDNSCPKSEKISSQLLNLPTHTNVSLDQAKYIIEKVNLWQNLQ